MRRLINLVYSINIALIGALLGAFVGALFDLLTVTMPTHRHEPKVSVQRQ